MTIDETILKALEAGPVTVDAILRRLEGPVRRKLERLRVRGVVLRNGAGGPHRKFTFILLRSDPAAEALREKGGLETPTELPAEVPSAAQAEGAGRKRRRTYLKITKYHFRRRREQKEG